MKYRYLEEANDGLEDILGGGIDARLDVAVLGVLGAKALLASHATGNGLVPVEESLVEALLEVRLVALANGSDGCVCVGGWVGASVCVWDACAQRGKCFSYMRVCLYKKKIIKMLAT